MPDSDRRPAGPLPTFLRPFAAVPRVASYHPAPAIEAARSDLERTVRRGEGFGVVVGPPGTGKTLLLTVLADRLRGDFDVALLAGARICTRRALWQSILAELGEPYRGLEEGDLRMAVVERVRALAASASGLVLLLDEAHTLPERLLEEIRLLSGLPTPIPAVHVVLAGTLDLEERLASPKRESLVQRVAVRCGLGRLDHAETAAYLRTQCAAASLRWEDRFAEGCADAIFTITDGVPRVINQVCDNALRLAEERREAGDACERVVPRDLQEAWRRIQQLPPTDPIGAGRAFPDCDGLDGGTSSSPDAEWSVAGPDDAGVGRTTAVDRPRVSRLDDSPRTDAIVEFGMLDDDAWVRRDPAAPTEPRCRPLEVSADVPLGPPGPPGLRETPPSIPCRSGTPAEVETAPAQDPWSGPDIELLFDPSSDPFEEMFESVEQIAGRLLVRGPDAFAACPRVVSDEGERLARHLDAWQTGHDGRPSAITVEAAPPGEQPAVAPAVEARIAVEDADEPACEVAIERDDHDLLVIEEDDDRDPRSPDPLVFAVGPADYRGLFARLRRGG